MSGVKKYFDTYYARHREEILAKAKKYYKQNRDKIIANNTAYSKKNSEKIKEERREWYRKYQAKYRLAHPGKAKKALQDWKIKNRERYLALKNKGTRTKYDFLIGLKKLGSCVNCGENDFRVLDWSHILDDSKEKPVGAYLSWKRLLKEIELCEFLCANCHRKRGYLEMQRRAKEQRAKNPVDKAHLIYVEKVRTYIKNLVKNGSCKKCGESDFRVLDWAHKKPGSKILDISHCQSFPKLFAELPRCFLLCANCHRRKDYAEKIKQDNLKRRAK